MRFTIAQKVLFRHCDPAGIVFYPRYFEMINDSVEAFFDSALGHPIEVLLRTGGIPTVRIDTVFTAPSRHGDMLELQVRCLRVGRTSVNLNISANCAGEERFSADSTLVYVDKNGRPQLWPSKLRAALDAQIEGGA